MNEVVFSILIPAFKGKFLTDAIESVQTQTYENWELILVDDNSPENLEQIVYPFVNEKIFYYRNDKNFGAVNVVENWNKCLSYSKGKYVICMGDDDTLAPTALERAHQIIGKYPELDVWHLQLSLIDEASNTYRGFNDIREEYESTYELLKARFYNRFQFIGDFVFRAEKLKKQGGFINMPTAWFSDEMTVAMMAGTKGIANTQEVGFNYRINDNTISNNTKLTIFKLDAADKAKEWYTLFIESNEAFSNSQREELRSLMFERIKKTKNACIAYDMSFHLMSGFDGWKSYCTRGELLKNWLLGLRLRVARIVRGYKSVIHLV